MGLTLVGIYGQRRTDVISFDVERRCATVFSAGMDGVFLIDALHFCIER